MVRTDLPFTYCHRKRLKHGVREYWRFRRGTIDTPLPSHPGDPAFHSRYAELCELEEDRRAKEEKAPHTMDWLIDRYRASAEFHALAGVTQTDYARILEYVRKGMGPEPFQSVDRASVKALRDTFAHQPRTAHKIKQVVSLLYSWADQADLVEAGFNPAANLKRLKWKAKPIEIWSDEEISMFLANCQPFMKTPVMLALYTGQRREDIVQMNWNDVQGEFVRIRQNKTGEPLSIPMHPELKKHLISIRSGFGGKIVRAADGKPMNANALSSALSRAAEAIVGMPHRTMHGLRYAAAGRLEAAGCSVVEITSVIGHRTYQMALKYMRQRKDAEAAIEKLAQGAS
jgi:integrase